MCKRVNVFMCGCLRLVDLIICFSDIFSTFVNLSFVLHEENIFKMGIFHSMGVFVQTSLSLLQHTHTHSHNSEVVVFVTSSESERSTTTFNKYLGAANTTNKTKNKKFVKTYTNNIQW